MDKQPVPSTSTQPPRDEQVAAIQQQFSQHLRDRQRARQLRDRRKEQQCTLKCKQTRGGRAAGMETSCDLSCTFDFTQHMDSLAALPHFKPEVDRYRFRSLEAHYTLNASFPLSHASNYLAHLSKSPLDIVRTFDALAETHAPVRRQRGELPPPPQLETVRFVHTADAVQHFCLRSERHIQRIYGPVFNRLSSLPGKIEDGSFAKQWVSTSEKVYERIASGEILRVGGKAMAQAVSWMGSGVGRAAAHVKAQITGSEEPPSSL